MRKLLDIAITVWVFAILGVALLLAVFLWLLENSDSDSK